MDYTNDDCMNAFSTGQVVYMRSILNSSRAQLITPGRTSCATDGGSDTNPTCSDGIKNGDETGIDCGGSCKPCEQANGVDAGISSLTYSSTSQSCAQSIRFSVNLNNYGSTNLKTATIEIRSQYGIITSYNWSGNLAAKGQTTINLPSINMNSGNYQVRAIVRNPNGKTDPNPANDQKNISLNIQANNQLVLVIKPDDFGADISWKIKDDQGKIVAKGGNYPDFNTKIISEPICIPSGCYRLIMSDSYGDGICCDYGKGWYELRTADGTTLLESDGYYGYSETQSFCLDNNNMLSRLATDRTIKRETNGMRKTNSSNQKAN